MDERPLRGALIGAGYFAGYHAEGWTRIPSAEIAAVADPAPGKARGFAARWGIPRASESAAEILDTERLDFVDIATRPEPHLELARLAASRGVHVIVQKPMAPSWSESVAMVESCEAAGVRLIVHENWRWQAWYREVKRLLDAGALGRPLQVGFRWRARDGIGPEPYTLQPYCRDMPRLLVYEALVHMLDTFRFLLGELAAVSCLLRRNNPVIRGEDQASIQVRFESGALGWIDGSRVSGLRETPPALGTLFLDGDHASLRMDPNGGLWLAVEGGEEAPHPYALPREGYRGDSVRAMEAHAIECLLSGRPAESEGRDYLRVVQAVEACYEAAASGREVRLDAPRR